MTKRDSQSPVADVSPVEEVVAFDGVHGTQGLVPCFGQGRSSGQDHQHAASGSHQGASGAVEILMTLAKQGK